MKKLKEIYAYRQMVISLVQRELRGRYKGSVLGFLWTFINPLMQLIVYTIVFSVIMRSGIEDYYIFLFVALIPWTFISNALSNGSVAITNSSEMVKKIYFPREVLPLASTISNFVNMLLCFIVVFVVLIVTRFGINFKALLYMPIILIVEFFLGLGMVLLASALNVYMRDIQHILGIVTMVWQFLTPIMYSSDIIPEKLMPIFKLNPMTPVIEAFRDILYYKIYPELSSLVPAALFALFFLVIGELVFSKLQRGFCEEL